MASQKPPPARRRREAAMRLPPLGDGNRDPLDRFAGNSRRPARVPRGQAEALDELDELGLCACWTAPRPHRRAV